MGEGPPPEQRLPPTFDPLSIHVSSDVSQVLTWRLTRLEAVACWISALRSQLIRLTQGFWAVKQS